MTSITFDISESMLVAIDRIAAGHEIDRGIILRDALTHYLGANNDLESDLAEADRQIEAGETIPHEEVVAWFESRISAAKHLNPD